MKKINPQIYSFVIVVVLVVCGFYILEKGQQSRDITQDLTKSRFIILKTITNPVGQTIYVATYNYCPALAQKFPDDKERGISCIPTCGSESDDACYFFEYELFTQKPRVIAKYKSEKDWLILSLIKFKDENTILLTTREEFLENTTDAYYHSRIYTKELNIDNGKITTVDIKELDTEDGNDGP